MLVDAQGREFKAQVGGYEGAIGSRGTRSWYAIPRSADADALLALPDLRGKSRDLARNNPIGGSAVDTLVNRVVGTGLAPSFRPNRRVLGWSKEQAAEFKAVAQDEWELWADSTFVDIAGALNFCQYQSLLFRGVVESGDDFTAIEREVDPRMPYSLRLRLLEADRIGNEHGRMDTATMAGGIEFDSVTGRRKRFFVYDEHPGGLVLKGFRKGRWIDAQTPRGSVAMLHHIATTRPEQSRGVPLLARVIEPLKKMGNYTDAELNAAVVAGLLTMVIESDAPESNALIGGESPSGSNSDSDLELASGGILGLAPGEKANMLNPGRPNPAFDGFMLSMFRLIGMGVGIPVEVLIKHYTASYSASRAALLDLGLLVRNWRAWARNSACKPIMDLFLEEAVASGRLKAPGFFNDVRLRAAYSRVEWNGDSPGSLNPRDEVRAANEAVDGGLLTRERAEMELFGTEWDTTYDQKVREHEMMEDGGLLPEKSEPAEPPAASGAKVPPGNAEPVDIDDPAQKDA